MKEKITPAQPSVKDKYKITNLKTYNKSLIKRGNITIWMEWKWSYVGKQKRDGKIIYSNVAIDFCYTIRCIYGLAYC